MSTMQNPNSISLMVRDMKASIAFYKKLGFTLKECWPSEQQPMWANLLLGQQSVMLGGQMSPEDAQKMCGGDEGAATYMATLAEELKHNQRGVGVIFYYAVPDVDRFREKLAHSGMTGLPECKTQFYGLRELPLQDPDGFRFMFYHLVQMESCQSCGMPLKDKPPGAMYCDHCVDEKGKLKPYEQILEGCVSGYFVPMQKMSRPQAEQAAREHLKKMPAWAGRS
jgi:uncharacterized glyoxalase superfamily protein PhnB